VGRRWLWANFIAFHDGRLAEAHDGIERQRAAVEASGEPVIEAAADVSRAFVDIWQGDPERPREPLTRRLEQALKLGAGIAVVWVTIALALAELATGRLEQARQRLEALLADIEGREAYVTSWALCLLADAQRLLGDVAADSTAARAQASGERLGNRLFATQARLTLGRLAAGRGDWATAQQHVLAHLDACAEGGHRTHLPACLDALAEVAAGLDAHPDAVRLFAAAERARAEIGVVRIPPEAEHWAAIDGQLRDALGDDAYQAARAEGTRLTIEDALAWARRGRGPRRRPPSGWGSLTPTEAKVAGLVAQGLTNPQIGERMFISPETVKTHLARIFRKIDVHTRAELTAHAARRNTTG
jgi:DNA-binding CsgD family transcriptional regulator